MNCFLALELFRIEKQPSPHLLGRSLVIERDQIGQAGPAFHKPMLCGAWSPGCAACVVWWCSGWSAPWASPAPRSGWQASSSQILLWPLQMVPRLPGSCHLGPPWVTRAAGDWWQWLRELFWRLPQYPWVDPTCPADLGVSRWQSRSLGVSPWVMGASFCSPSMSSRSKGWLLGQKLVLPSDWSKEGIEYLCLFLILCHCFPLISNKGRRFSFCFSCIYRSLLLSFTAVARWRSSWLCSS